MNLTINDIRKYMKENNIEQNLDLENPIKSLGILKIEKKNNNKLWNVKMRGPKNSYYEKGIFIIEIDFNDFPSKPPKVFLKQK